MPGYPSSITIRSYTSDSLPAARASSSSLLPSSTHQFSLCTYLRLIKTPYMYVHISIKDEDQDMDIDDGNKEDEEALAAGRESELIALLIYTVIKQVSKYVYIS
jgi:hypothetical protein